LGKGISTDKRGNIEDKELDQQPHDSSGNLRIAQLNDSLEVEAMLKNYTRVDLHNETLC
jgi:hypothetical protein